MKSTTANKIEFYERALAGIMREINMKKEGAILDTGDILPEYVDEMGISRLEREAQNYRDIIAELKKSQN